MTPDAVIESYVRDVATNLPGRMRDEVTDELRGQLADELAGRATAEGRAADVEMALSLVHGFGRPEEMAARYYTPFVIIDPAETRRFILVAVVGYVMLSTIVVTLARLGVEAAREFDSGPFAWIGLLTVVYGLRSWMRRRDPGRLQWSPQAFHDIEKVNYASLLSEALGTAVLLAAYVLPGPVAEFLSGGRVAAEGLAYTRSFIEDLRMPWLAGILALNLALLGWVAAKGRWGRWSRYASIAIGLHIVLQLGWHISYGLVFVDPAVERPAFVVAALVILVVSIDVLVLVYRESTWIGPRKTAAAA